MGDEPLNDEQLHTFVPKDCDVYAVGLQEAGGEIQQVDAEEAYVQAYLEGPETWISLLDDAWSSEERRKRLISPD